MEAALLTIAYPLAAGAAGFVLFFLTKRVRLSAPLAAIVPSLLITTPWFVRITWIAIFLFFGMLGSIFAWAVLSRQARIAVIAVLWIGAFLAIISAAYARNGEGIWLAFLGTIITLGGITVFALPGGRWDPNDPAAQTTATRDFGTRLQDGVRR
ncbi:MAG: hypothetical protein ACYC5Y_01645 [Symbiobacteriia bacterium]